MKVSIYGFVVILLLMFVCKGMHNGDDSSGSDESDKAVGNCLDLDFDDMMASTKKKSKKTLILSPNCLERILPNRGINFCSGLILNWIILKHCSRLLLQLCKLGIP